VDTVTETVGRNRLLKATKDVTGAALATRLGSTQSFIWRVLKGTRLPGRALAARIAEEFPEIPTTTWDQAPSESGGTEPKVVDPAATPAPAATGTDGSR
jgi:transcriptional regulator with XRE-family HTH domain